eukprot:XP_011606512.1 PREDICTED: tumor protein p53-inducible protein 13 [Takifugu rubripes]
MPSRSRSSTLVRAVLAAVWLASCRGDVPGAQRPGCDNGKLRLQRDLPDGVYRDCPVSAWPESKRKHPTIDRVYDPEPARQICMDEPIFYKRAVPNSGAFRPVMAESGEYVYCPPQRWLNNLHHAATVLLHHPCAPFRERLVLSVLARSCLTHYVLTSHPKLRRHTPLALVSWGRTLELSTAASLEICDWLESSTSTNRTAGGTAQGRKYNLLLTRSAEEPLQQRAGEPSEASAGPQETPRQCCEKVISSFLVKEKEPHSNRKRKRRAALQAKRGKREIRAASAEESDAHSENVTEKSIPVRDTSALPDVDGSKHVDSQDLSAGTTSVSGSNISQRARRLTPQPAAERLWPGEEINHSGGPGDKGSPGDGDPGVAPSQSELVFQPQLHHHIQTSQECEGCRAGERCQCTVGPVAEAGAPLVKKGFPKSPRTDEAVWAAAALGSLLVLLALAVLHTRLYRHWRTAPSLYWYDPHRDYESVADVMRRRLRIAKRRSKRSRRHQCVLLPVSSSSDEN